VGLNKEKGFLRITMNLQIMMMTKNKISPLILKNSKIDFKFLQCLNFRLYH